MTSSKTQEFNMNMQRQNIKQHMKTLQNQKYISGVTDAGNGNSVFHYENNKYNISDLYAAVIILIKIVKYLYNYLEDQIEAIRKDIVECIIQYFKDKGITDSTSLSSTRFNF